MVTFVNFTQLRKVPFAISVIESLNSILFNLEQFSKADSPRLITEEGILMLTKLVHFLKAQSPMFVNPSGSVILDSLTQPLKASLPILKTVSGITMLEKSHPENAPRPIHYREVGRVILERPKHPEKVLSSMQKIPIRKIITVAKGIIRNSCYCIRDSNMTRTVFTINYDTTRDNYAKEV